jgi:hypothetical protein
MRKAVFCLRLLFLLASLSFAGASLFPAASGASDAGRRTSIKCPTNCGPQGPIWCGGVCRRLE